jgi:hypothetical protein
VVRAFASSRYPKHNQANSRQRIADPQRITGRMSPGYRLGRRRRSATERSCVRQAGRAAAPQRTTETECQDIRRHQLGTMAMTRNSRLFLPIMLLALLVAGCSNEEAFTAADHTRCRELGFRPDASEYADCVYEVHRQRTALMPRQLRD